MVRRVMDRMVTRWNGPDETGRVYRLGVVCTEVVEQLRDSLKDDVSNARPMGIWSMGEERHSAPLRTKFGHVGERAWCVDPNFDW